MVGKISVTRNLDQKVTASSAYYRVLVLNKKNKPETLLLTEGELTRVRDRVKKNPEDEITPSFLDRMILWIVKVLG